MSQVRCEEVMNVTTMITLLGCGVLVNAHISRHAL